MPIARNVVERIDRRYPSSLCTAPVLDDAGSLLDAWCVTAAERGADMSGAYPGGEWAESLAVVALDMARRRVREPRPRTPEEATALLDAVVARLGDRAIATRRDVLYVPLPRTNTTPAWGAFEPRRLAITIDIERGWELVLENTARLDAAVAKLVATILGGPPGDDGTLFVCTNPCEGSGCGCRECAALRHLRTATCSVTGCDRRSTWRLIRTWPGPATWRTPAEPGDPNADAVELPRAPHGMRETFYACGTVHVRTLLEVHRDIVSPVFGTITATWDVDEYRWRPRAANLPASFALATAAFDDARAALFNYGNAIGEGRLAAAAEHADDLTHALVLQG